MNCYDLPSSNIVVVSIYLPWAVIWSYWVFNRITPTRHTVFLLPKEPPAPHSGQHMEQLRYLIIKLPSLVCLLRAHGSVGSIKGLTGRFLSLLVIISTRALR